MENGDQKFKTAATAMKVASRSYVFAALKQYSLYKYYNNPHPNFYFPTPSGILKQRGGQIFKARANSLNMLSSSSKNNSNTQAQGDNDDMILPTKSYDFPMIDVDCNLIHPDLVSLLSTSSLYDEKAKAKFFNILHHPSTSLSNIQGMFSPSSTIDEAEEFHEALIGSDTDSRNNIDVRMSVGIHPYHTSEKEIGTFNSEENSNNIQSRIKALLEKDAGHGLITCIGETGLDYSDGFPNRDEQLPWFEFQLQQAKAYKMPIFIHERLAFQDTIDIIDKIFPKDGNDSKDEEPKIIVHCFTGNTEELKEYISRGYYISVSGYVLKSGDGPDEINRCLKDGIIPLDKLMIETDAPYMGFNTCRETYYEIESIISEEFKSLKSKKKKSLMKSIYPNVPAALPKVLEHVVSVINEGRKERDEEELSMDTVSATFLNNSKYFFGF